MSHPTNEHPSSLPRPLCGVIPPMITPLHDQDALDLSGLDRLIHHMVDDGGVHGLFVLGTTGEGPSLSYALRRQLVRETCERVAGRVPVLVGVTDASPVETQQMTAFAADAGADAVVLATPFYYPLSQDDLLAYVRNLMPSMALPVFLYNMPSHTKVAFEPDTVVRLLDEKQIVGFKDSSAGASCLRAVQPVVARRRPDWSLLVGPEATMAELVPLGAHGGVCGGANVFPRLFVELYEAAASGDRERVEMLQAQVLRLPATLYGPADDPYGAIRRIKGALSIMQVCSDRTASPLRSVSVAERAELAHHLDHLNGSIPLLASHARRSA